MSKFWAHVEAKVKWASVAAFLVSILIAVLNGTVGNSDLMGGLPPWSQFLLVAATPTLLTFLAGYQAPHEEHPPVPVIDTLSPRP